MQVPPEKWDRAKTLFDEALQRDPGARHEFLVQACPEDDLRLLVEDLIWSHEEANNFFIHAPWASSVPSTQSQAFAVGDLLAERFQITRFIAKGGMGEVYEAKDLELNERVAIKTIRREILSHPHTLAMFKREVHLAKQVTHPNVCRIFDLFRHRPSGAKEESDEICFVSMELLASETLAERLRKVNRMAKEEAFPIVTQIAKGLGAAHEVGILHRDLKPGNVILMSSGDRIRAVITDFGMALRSNIGLNISLTPATTNEAFGTPAYMSPEQIEGRELTPASDIYALGLVMYNMVTGVHPFGGEKPISIALRRLTETPAPPKRLVPELDPIWDWVILRCLERCPANRFSTTDQVVNALRGEQAVLPRKGHRSVWLSLAIVIILSILTGLSYRFLFHKRSAVVTQTDTIVLADFHNSTGDAVFDGTLKQALAVDIGQSPFLTILSEQKVRDTLQRMTRPMGVQLTNDLAREVCQRAEGKAYIGGSINRLGEQYVIGLEAVNCATGEVLARDQATAMGKERVLDTLGRTVKELRKKLGESLGSVQRFDVPLAQATTSSLDALKFDALARKAQYEKGDAEAIPFEKRAIELDPNFALAYDGLAVDYANLNQSDLAADYLKKAFDLRDRVTERERFHISSLYYHFVTGEVDKAIQTYMLWSETYPRDHAAHANAALDYVALGQFERAVSETRDAIQLEPNDVVGYENLAALYLALNRINDAQTTLEDAQRRKLDDIPLHVDLYGLAFLHRNRTVMKQQGDWAVGKPGAEDWVLSLESDTEAYFGRLQNARELSRRAVASASRADAKESAALWEVYAAIREALVGNADKARKGAAVAFARAPLSRDVKIETAMAYALAGNDVSAQSLANDLVKRYPQDTLVQLVWLPTIRAQIEIRHHKPAAAIHLLQMTRPYDMTIAIGGSNNSCLYPVYVRAEALLASHEAAAAAAEFQKFLDHEGLVQNCTTGALARLGLARAYAVLAKSSHGSELRNYRTKARSGYQDFLALWKDADPSIPVLYQAKKEYAKL